MLRLLDKRPNVLFLLMLLVGIGGLAAAEGMTFFDERGTAKELIKGLSEAIIVAGVFGFVIERPLRRIFAEDVARDAFLTLFGVNAPRHYVEGLEAVCRTDRLSYNVIWQISLDWHRKPSTLAIQMECRNHVHNIGSKPFVPKGLWLMGSMQDTPGSRFLRYEIDIVHADDRVDRRPALNESELSDIAYTDGGDLSIEVTDLLGPDCQVPVGAKTETALTGLVYLGVPGVIPLFQNYPSLKVEFVVQGDALKDLDLKVQSGTAPLKELPARDGRRRFETQELALPGATFHIRYSLRGQPLVAHGAENEAEAALP